MKWTKELPTEEGWYWINNGNWCDTGMVEIWDGKDYHIDGLVVHTLRDEMPNSLKDYVGTYFYGPIESPEFEWNEGTRR